MIWKYSQADFVKASELIEETDWDQLFSGKSIDEACIIWEETFLSIMDQCIPKGVLPKRRIEYPLGLTQHQAHYLQKK